MATVEMATELLLTQGNGGEALRRELGTFLRSRRERVRPEDVGLRLTRRRRTPGLRREEVAQLAGVGVTWYTWLEQGRDINPSAQVLDAIAWVREPGAIHVTAAPEGKALLPLLKRVQPGG